MALQGLDRDFLNRVKTGASQRGIYRQLMEQFINSGLDGVSASDDWASELSDRDDQGNVKPKTTATVKQGFENVKNNTKNPLPGSDRVGIYVYDDKVYLLLNDGQDAQAGQAGQAEPQYTQA